MYKRQGEGTVAVAAAAAAVVVVVAVVVAVAVVVRCCVLLLMMLCVVIVAPAGAVFSRTVALAVEGPRDTACRKSWVVRHAVALFSSAKGGGLIYTLEAPPPPRKAMGLLLCVVRMQFVLFACGCRRVGVDVDVGVGVGVGVGVTVGGVPTTHGMPEASKTQHNPFSY